MSKPTIRFPIPLAEEVRTQLAAAVAETRYLRRLLQLAKEADEARRLRHDEEAPPCRK